MKAGGAGSSGLPLLRGKRISFSLLLLVCTTFLIWGLDRHPFQSIVEKQPEIQYLSHHNLPNHQVTGAGSVLETSPEEKLQPADPVESNFSSMNAEYKPLSGANQSKPTNVSDKLQNDPDFGKQELTESTDLRSNMPETHEDDANKTASSVISDNTGCDYRQGKWVYDSKRPLYSGKTCKRWLAAMWACRLTNRNDFSYEKYKWQPDHCEMPYFQGNNFLSSMRDKTLAFIGDSLGRQQFQSMMCLITGGEDALDVLDIGAEYGLVKARRALRPDGWAYKFPKTNTTVLYYWSASLCLIEPLNLGDPHTDFAMHLDKPAAFLRDNLHRFDVVVLNTGHHWNRGKLNANRWKMYADGKPVTSRSLSNIQGARNHTVHSVVKWLDSQLLIYPKLRAFMRSMSPRHFFNGDWNTGGSCDNTQLLARANLTLKSRITDPVAESAVRGTAVVFLDITGLSQLRDEAHLSKYSITVKNGGQDCLHWCLPGVPDTWNELLFAQLLHPGTQSTADKYGHNRS